MLPLIMLPLKTPANLNSLGVVALLSCEVEKRALDVASDDPPDPKGPND